MLRRTVTGFTLRHHLACKCSTSEIYDANFDKCVNSRMNDFIEQLYSNSVSFRSLLKAAEEVHLPKALRQEFGGGVKEFVGSEANCFEGSDDEIRFFTTQERQSLVLHLLHTLRAGPHDLHSLPGLKLVEGQAIVPKCISSGIISQVRYTYTCTKKRRTYARIFKLL